ncbi:tRNA glutamyl-Q(34) synthetase GluQRS [Granulicella sp. dw_53]|uniref:tRNA glutamyl-Q(34) synthetase GluQRS n=1 Tax=Granulicella sp. dw_53 TaxID=2719792 RepID=UPI001BD6017C|nr:tRNA glutamyl-Q(34) synthetase GluQRS [Granulicella sp. dw_53]
MSNLIPTSYRQGAARYIGRIAPSPTGLLHLGHAATFWTAHQRAQEAEGKLLLRNEDLDPHRSRAGFVEAMLEDLAWLCIVWTPPMVSQSERLALYREALDRLLLAGHSYPCRCSRQDLARMAHAPHDDHAAQEPDDERVYPNICRPALREQHLEPAFQPNTNYRFRVPDGAVLRFTDRNLGPRAFTAGIDFGDFLIWRKDGVPSYQLACVVDDAAMGITEVVRGRDLLKSTARQMLLQRALGLTSPEYFHTPLLVDSEGNRLAKRHDALALRTLRERGHSPERVIAMFQASAIRSGT